MQLDNFKKITLEESSKDDEDGTAVVKCQDEVYCFDDVSKMIASVYRRSKPHTSCDALYVKNKDNIFLIEFKNVRRSRVPKKSLMEKAYDSIMTLQMAFFPNYSLNDMKEKVSLVFVYNNDGIVEKEEYSECFDKFKNKLSELSGEKDNILFNLEIYKGILYKDVFTVEKVDFMNKIYPMIFFN